MAHHLESGSWYHISTTPVPVQCRYSTGHQFGVLDFQWVTEFRRDANYLSSYFAFEMRCKFFFRAAFSTAPIVARKRDASFSPRHALKKGGFFGKTFLKNC